jgi:hypothetical protein
MPSILPLDDNHRWTGPANIRSVAETSTSSPCQVRSQPVSRRYWCSGGHSRQPLERQCPPSFAQGGDLATVTG